MKYRGLRLVRTARGVTGEELQALTGIRQVRLSLIERGIREPTERELDVMSVALDCPRALLTAEAMRLSVPGSDHEVEVL